MIRSILDVVREYKDIIATFLMLAFQAYTFKEIKNVHITVNSRMSELLALTAKASKAEGVKQEKDAPTGDLTKA